MKRFLFKHRFAIIAVMAGFIWQCMGHADQPREIDPCYEEISTFSNISMPYGSKFIFLNKEIDLSDLLLRLTANEPTCVCANFTDEEVQDISAELKRFFHLSETE